MKFILLSLLQHGRLTIIFTLSGYSFTPWFLKAKYIYVLSSTKLYLLYLPPSPSPTSEWPNNPFFHEQHYPGYQAKILRFILNFSFSLIAPNSMLGRPQIPLSKNPFHFPKVPGIHPS